MVSTATVRVTDMGALMRMGPRLRLVLPLALIAAVLVPAVPADAGVPGPVSMPLQSAPADPKFTDVITVSGTLIFGDGEPVVTPTELTVSRSRRDATAPSVALPSVTTAADGTFAFTDLPGAGPWRYAVTYPGTAQHTRWTAWINVDVRRFKVEVSAELAPGQTVQWGQYAHYVGRVTAAEGPAISTPLSIGGSASGTCGWSGAYIQVQSAADGTFAFDARPACPHDSTLSVGSGSDAEHEPGSAPALSSAVERGPPLLDMGCAFPGDPWITDWQRPTVVTAGISFWAVGRGLLDVYVQPYGKSKVLLSHGWLNYGMGTGTNPDYYADRRTVVTAVYHGDEGLLPSSRTCVLSVRPYVHHEISNAYRAADGWKLFHLRTNPHITASIKPAHAGKSLRIVAQRYVNGTWRPEVSRSVAMDRDGFIYTAYRGHRAVGAKFRVQTKWLGDVDHAPVSTGWRYFRFTT